MPSFWKDRSHCAVAIRQPCPSQRRPPTSLDAVPAWIPAVGHTAAPCLCIWCVVWCFSVSSPLPAFTFTPGSSGNGKGEKLASGASRGRQGDKPPQSARTSAERPG